MKNPLDPKQLHAWFFIGWHGLKGWLLRAFRPDRTGLDIFRENYVAEGLPPIPPAARERYHTFVRCTACGSCDQVCPITPKADALEWQGPMMVVISMARAAPHYRECVPALKYFDRCGDCRACEVVCPEHIPIREVAQMMRAAVVEIEATRPEPPPSPAARPGPG
ncbi:MAG: hypothetical protein AB2A00_29355 [Myxococcota bacterium]